MRSSRIMSFIVLMIINILFQINSWAFNDSVTHPELTGQAIKYSGIKTYLTETLKLDKGVKEKIGELLIEDWIKYGAQMEDHPACRASNHFHNPSLLWDESGLSDTFWLCTLYCYLFINYHHNAMISDLTWATGYSVDPYTKDKAITDKNEWDWESAKEYFYVYLTGRDFQGDRLATDDESRKKYLAKCMQALGQVMHLLQDMAVPAHVRNDFSQGHLMHVPQYFGFPWLGNRFEGYVMSNNGQSWFNNRIGSYFSKPFLTDFWDTTYYSGENLLSPMGLSEYTQLNFLSEYTMFTDSFQYPNPENCVIEYDPAFATLPDLDRPYIASTKGHPGEPVHHLAVVSSLDHYRKVYFPNISNDRLPLSMDENCYNEYASKLIPRAIGYSAELLNYFFRGELKVISVPLFWDGKVYSFRLNIKNTTQSHETLSNGTFALFVRYTPDGGNDDGSDDIFVQCNEVESGELQYDQNADYQFFLADDVPITNFKSVKCILAFKGDLGIEKNAVIGNVFFPGKIKFIEEWDNGLSSQEHPWFHSTADQNADPDQIAGITSNTIENEILKKDNIRYANNRVRRINQSFIYFTDLGDSHNVPNMADPNGILITPDTYLQFQIDDLSINEQPPEEPGHTTAYQYLQLEFNAVMNGQHMYNFLALEFTQPDQGVDQQGIIELPYSFSLGLCNVFNIYDLFQSQGIDIPQPFYLQCIELNQKLDDLALPSTVDHHQHMEVDFISIVEGNNQQDQ